MKRNAEGVTPRLPRRNESFGACSTRATLASDDGPIFSAVSKHRSVI